MYSALAGVAHAWRGHPAVRFPEGGLQEAAEGCFSLIQVLLSLPLASFLSKKPTKTYIFFKKVTCLIDPAKHI